MPLEKAFQATRDSTPTVGRCGGGIHDRDARSRLQHRNYLPYYARKTGLSKQITKVAHHTANLGQGVPTVGSGFAVTTRCGEDYAVSFLYSRSERLGLRDRDTWP